MARLIGIEVNFVAEAAETGRHSRNFARRMKHELPLALIPEEAECAPGAEERDGEDDGEGFEDPARVD